MSQRPYQTLGNRHLVVEPALPDQAAWWFIGRARPLPGYRMGANRHGQDDVLVQLVWHAEGATLHLDDRDQLLPTPCALLRPESNLGVAWSLPQASADAELMSLIGRGAWLRQCVASLMQRFGPVLAIDPEQAVFKELAGIAKRNAQLPLLQDGGAAFSLVARTMAALQGPQQQPVGLAQQAARYLLQHMSQSIEIAELAVRLGVSREHLTRCFTRHYGTSPSRWLRLQRLELAYRLLQHSEDSISSIASKVGFANSQHFSHAFREHFGHAASAVRQVG